MTVRAVYQIPWTEFERGWGRRPDGATLYRDREAIREHLEEWNEIRQRETEQNPGVVPDEFSNPDYTDPKEVPLVEVPEEVFNEVQAKGMIWVKREYR